MVINLGIPKPLFSNILRLLEEASLLIISMQPLSCLNPTALTNLLKTDMDQTTSSSSVSKIELIMSNTYFSPRNAPLKISSTTIQICWEKKIKIIRLLCTGWWRPESARFTTIIRIKWIFWTEREEWQATASKPRKASRVLSSRTPSSQDRHPWVLASKITSKKKIKQLSATTAVTHLILISSWLKEHWKDNSWSKMLVQEALLSDWHLKAASKEKTAPKLAEPLSSNKTTLWNENAKMNRQNS